MHLSGLGDLIHWLAKQALIYWTLILNLLNPNSLVQKGLVTFKHNDIFICRHLEDWMLTAL